MTRTRDMSKGIPEDGPSRRSEASAVRYSLGQYFTQANLADLILGFCLRLPSDRVLDPCCGKGVFLERSFSRLLYLGCCPRTAASNLRGIEISPRLASASSQRLHEILTQHGIDSEPNIDRGDFLLSESTKQGLDSWCESAQQNTVAFDGVVGNPPYTRQEELSSRYKRRISEVLRLQYPSLKIPSTMGFHGYFMLRSLGYLRRDGGRLGFVTLRSWLDTDYGRVLEKFILQQTKVIAIVAPRIESWFADAQMLPCVVIVERCQDTDVRETNTVKFVLLKETLENLFAPANEDHAHWNAIDQFVSTVTKLDLSAGAQPSLWEDNRMRVLGVSQSILATDHKWGKFLHVPAVFFKVMDKARPLLSRLEQNATVKRGIVTGANDFFIIPNKFFAARHEQEGLRLRSIRATNEFLLEWRFVQPLLSRVRTHRRIAIDEPDAYLLSVSERKAALKANGCQVADYIEEGERRMFTKRRGLRKGSQARFSDLPTLKSRKEWYCVPRRQGAPIIFPNIFWKRHIVFLNRALARTTNVFFEIFPKEPKDSLLLCAILNSTFAAMCGETSGRYVQNQDGTRSNQLVIQDLKELPVINLSLIAREHKESILRTFSQIIEMELGKNQATRAEAMSEIDRILLEKVIGVSSEDLEEFVKATAALFEERSRHVVEREGAVLND